MKTLLTISALVAAQAFGAAETVLNKSFSEDIGESVLVTQANFSTGTGLPPYNWHHLFDGISFGTQDVGRVFTIASPLDDPDFGSVTTALTNGSNDEIFWLFTAGGGSGGVNLESDLFAAIDKSGPDLLGYQIQSFSLRIDRLTFESPGRNPNGDGIWTDWRGQVTLTIEASQIPEPSCTCLALLALAVLAMGHRKRSQP